MADSFVADSFIPDEPVKVAAQPPTREPEGDRLSPLAGGIADTLGLTKRPGARTPVDVLAKPQGIPEHLARIAVTAPAIYLGGRVVGPAAAGLGLGTGAVAGNMAAAGAVGAGEAALGGKAPGQVLYSGLIDAIVAGLTEGVITGVTDVPKVGLKALGAPARAFQWATEAPMKALDAVAARIGKGKWFNVPSLSKTPMTATEAVEALARKEGLAYQQGREEIASEMNRLDMQRLTGPKPLAGQVFKKGTARERFQAPSLSRARKAETARGVLSDPAARAAADAAMTEDPNIALGAALSVPGFGEIASHVLPHMVP